MRGAAYKGVPLRDLRIEAITWTEDAANHIRSRTTRTGRPGEFDVEPEWATEAALDPRRIVRLARPNDPTTQSLKVVGYSDSAMRLLKVWIWSDSPGEPDWYGGSAAEANESDERLYWKLNGEG